MKCQSNGAFAGVGVAVLTLAILVANDTMAIAECKGKSNSACERDEGCSWVKGYTRSNGAKVTAFCRAKPRQGSKASGSSTRKSGS